jgi:hypothetical protein
MPMPHVVVSYARVDHPLVREIVKLLRAAYDVRRAVFWDDDFQTGKDWALQFRSEVNRTRRVFVMWCVHSSVSKQVRAEYNFALKRAKNVVPVLLDDTRLPRPLAKLQGVDLRQSFRHRRRPARAAKSTWIGKGRPHAGFFNQPVSPLPRGPRLSDERRRRLLDAFQPFLLPKNRER